MKQLLNYRLVACASFFLLLLFSCKKTSQNEKDASSISQEDDKVIFARILSKAVMNQPVRDFLKTEALKKFGADYDVFIPLVKNQVLSNGVSFNDYLQQIAVEQKITRPLAEIEANLPLLDILVPETIIFSAKNWNTDNTIPLVGIRNIADIKSKKKMAAYNATGDIVYMDYDQEPDRAVIVIKDNEALQIVDGNSARTMRAGTYQYTKPRMPVLVDNGLSYYFADETLYDPLPADEETAGPDQAGRVPVNTVSRVEGGACSRLYNWNYFDIRVQDAFEKNIYNPVCPDNIATVRDYVYYGIDPTTGVDQGPLNYSYREYITSIKCDDLNSRGRFDDLTEGSILDFDIIIYTADNDPIFPLKKRLSVPKDQFFTTDVDNPTPMAYEFGGYPRPAIELAVWNFKRQGDIWKFGVFEFDPGTTVSETKSISSTLGTNFTIGEEKKGGKFGISATVTASRSTTITYTDGSDDLGEAVLYWCDPVIKEKVIETSNTQAICGLPHLRRPVRRVMSNTYGRSSEISTGIISLTIEPRVKL